MSRVRFFPRLDGWPVRIHCIEAMSRCIQGQVRAAAELIPQAADCESQDQPIITFLWRTSSWLCCILSQQPPPRESHQVNRSPGILLLPNPAPHQIQHWTRLYCRRWRKEPCIYWPDAYSLLNANKLLGSCSKSCRVYILLHTRRHNTYKGLDNSSRLLKQTLQDRIIGCKISDLMSENCALGLRYRNPASQTKSKRWYRCKYHDADDKMFWN